MKLSALGLSSTAQPNSGRSIQTSGSKHPRGQDATLQALLDSLYLQTLDDEEVQNVTDTVALRKNLQKIKVSKTLSQLGTLRDDRYSDLTTRDPEEIYGPDLTTFCVAEACKFGFAQLTPDEQNQISSTGSFLQDSSNSPSSVIAWLAKSLVEEPILIHGPLVCPTIRADAKANGFEIYSICALCHYNSSIRAQIKPKLLPFLPRNSKRPHSLASRFVGVESQLQAHYQQPVTVLSQEVQEKGKLSTYIALHRLIHHTLSFLYNKKTGPNEKYNNKKYRLWKAITEDLDRHFNPEKFAINLDDDDDDDDADERSNSKSIHSYHSHEDTHKKSGATTEGTNDNNTQPIPLAQPSPQHPKSKAIPSIVETEGNGSLDSVKESVKPSAAPDAALKQINTAQ